MDRQTESDAYEPMVQLAQVVKVIMKLKPKLSESHEAEARLF